MDYSKVYNEAGHTSGQKLGTPLPMKILVITPPGFHVGYLGCYGNAWIETPTLDALASEGVVFDHHYSDCPTGDGAWRAWRTGRFDFPLPGVQSELLPHGSSDILSTLRAQHIPAWQVMDPPGTPSLTGGILWEEIRLIQSRGCPGMLSRLVMKFMRQMKWFDHGLIWVQPDFLLPPWEVDDSNLGYFSVQADEESDETPIEPLPNPTQGLLDSSDETTFIRLQRTYADAVSYLDGELRELFDQLRQSDSYDSLMIIVTSERGFSLGEHAWVGNGQSWLHEELVHVPLIFRLPHGVAASGRVSALTQPLDLMPTLLEAFNLPAAECHGSSLLPLIRGERERIRDFACSGLKKMGAIEYALRTLDWAFLLPEQLGAAHEVSGTQPRDRQLYVKPEDRWEINNVVQHYPDIAEQLEQILRAFVKAPKF